jgi:WD40 repeat protein
VAFSPRGDLLAAVLLDDSVRIWGSDGASRAVLSSPHRERHVRGISFSPKGDLFATAGWDGTARFWNADGSPRGEPIEANFNIVLSVSFSPAGDRLATTGKDDRVRIWNSNGTLWSEFPRGSRDRVTTIALAKDSPMLAAADDRGQVRLWNFDGAPLAKPLAAHKGPVNAVAFSPVGDIVVSAGRNDRIMRLWNVKGGTPVDGPLTVGPRVEALVFSPQGDALAVATAPFQLWRQSKLLWKQPLRSADRVQSISFSPRGDFIVTGTYLGDLQVWNLDGSPRTLALKQKWEYIAAVAVAPGGDYFAAVNGGGEQRIFSLFNLDGSPRGAPLEGGFGWISALAFSPGGQLVSGGEDGVVRFWTLPSRQVETIDVGLPINQLGFWHDVLWVRADGESVFFYDTQRKLRASVLLRSAAALAFSEDGWYGGGGQLSRYVRVFRESGEVLSEEEAARYMSSSRLMASLTDRR